MAHTIVVVPDVHLEPGTPLDPSYVAVRGFIRDLRPDHVMLLGDFGEFECFNHHDRKKKLLLEGARYSKTVDLLNGELDFLQKYSNAVHYCLGNHEGWVVKYVEEHPEVQGKVDLVQDLGLEGRGIRWCEWGETLSIGKINFSHGWRVNLHHAKASALEFGDHIFYGHTHDHQEYTPHFRKDQSPYAAVSCGCLCSRNPSYMRGVATRWINGFVYFEVRPDGNFNHHWLAIVDGKFSYGGQIWG